MRAIFTGKGATAIEAVEICPERKTPPLLCSRSRSRLEAGRPLERIGGLLLRSAGDLRATAAAPACDSACRDFIVPDRSLLRPWLSTYVVGRATGPSTYLFTSLLTPMSGTPFHREVVGEIVDHDLAKYNFFNRVLKTILPLVRFYEQVGALWPIRMGTETN